MSAIGARSRSLLRALLCALGSLYGSSGCAAVTNGSVAADSTSYGPRASNPSAEREPVAGRNRRQAAIVAGGVGGALVGAGTASVMFGLPACRNDAEFATGAEQAGYCAGVILPAAVGAGVLLWAREEYRRARDPAADPRPRPAPADGAPRTASHPLDRPYPE